MQRFRQAARVVLAFTMCAGAAHAQMPPEAGAGVFADAESLRMAIEDLERTHGEAYPGEEFLQRLGACGSGEQLAVLAREALLTNPLLDFNRLLVLKRAEGNLGLPRNWQSNSSLPRAGFDNELAVMRLSELAAPLKTLYRPERDVFVGDVDLDFDAEHLLFSSVDEGGRWGVFEMSLADGTVAELPLVDERDVDNYDACYLPDGGILFSSTAPFVGVPCVTGASHVSNLYLWTRAGDGTIRRLTFEQDHDWCPTVLPNGRVIYLRWEYTDIPHFASRILFHMNPDGTGQMEYYGSNSYWPNAMFYARPVPDTPAMFAAVVGGHHDHPRMGELVLFDAARGRHEADGVVQRIPGRGEPVEPILLDGLTQDSWPKFLHPYPLSAEYLLVSVKPNPEAKWGIYLVDVFDNMLLLREEAGYALFEPLPLRPHPRPPVIPPRMDATREDALVYLTDVYLGPGLEGVPRGKVKQLRLLTYHFAYHGMGGQINRIGLDGPWDIKRVLGTVPVEADGSAFFRVPANTPISVQPLDQDGRALQLMRSWMTAMPGETVSCIGCHEKQSMTPPTGPTIASRRAPSDIAPWYGPTRGFSFKRELQPVLDAYCVECHDGAANRPDLRDGEPIEVDCGHAAYVKGSRFPPSYVALRGYVRTPTMESDMHLLPAAEFHASTTHLVRMLEQGHHEVALDAEAWDRLNTWIDLHAPAHGTWHEVVGQEKTFHQRDRRREMLRQYAGIDEDPEAILDLPEPDFDAIQNRRETPRKAPEAAAVWTGASQAAEPPGTSELDLGGGVTMTLVRVPPGLLERPGRDPLRIADPFWMGACEVTNAQFARFDPNHDSRLEHGDFLQFSVEERGYPLNGPDQPVVRVSWEQASAFCAWLSAKTGQRVTLPDEGQWEYACLAGGAGPMGYGDCPADFAPFANLADAEFREVDTFKPWNLPSDGVPEYRPAVTTVNDGFRVSAPAGSFAANAWGLHDLHGNVAEWTCTVWGGDESGNGDTLRAVKGGSWSERPRQATAWSRWRYPEWQRVHNVGFRVVVVAEDAARGSSVVAKNQAAKKSAPQFRPKH